MAWKVLLALQPQQESLGMLLGARRRHIAWLVGQDETVNDVELET